VNLKEHGETGNGEAETRSRIAQIQAALDQNHQGGSFKAGIQPVGMAVDDEMGMSYCRA
jgi:hypothetical protein